MSAVCSVAGCGKALGPRNRSGLCRGHSGAAVLARLDPAARERARLARAAALRRTYQENPALRDAARERLRALTRSTAHRQRARERMARDPIWVKGQACCHSPEASARRARTRAARALGWCPEARRDEYRRLMRNAHLSAAEARAVIEADLAAELRRRLCRTGRVR